MCSSDLELPLREASPPSGNVPSKAADPGWKEQERAYKQRQTERDQTAAKAEKEKTKLEVACARARARLTDLNTAGRVYETNDKGERQFLSDQQRNAAIAQSQQEYNQHCN